MNQIEEAEKYLKYLPSKLKAEITSTGGGYYSVIIPLGEHHIDISAEYGGASLFSNDGSFIATLSDRSNPLTLAKFVTDFWSLNME